MHNTPLLTEHTHSPAQMSAFLVLENGSSFNGELAFPLKGPMDGEVVFSTGMTGYDASLTDPSYSGQILVFTYPLIGNYGVPPKEQWESERVYASGVVVSELCKEWSHGACTSSLQAWLEVQNVPLISGVDTREVTKVLREAGTMLGSICQDPSEKRTFFSPFKIVSIPNKRIYGTKGKKIIAVDCGMKKNIIRCLQKHPVQIHHVPHDYDYSEEEYDGVFLSNGPGDPEAYSSAISILKKALAREKPIFGICLGAQLMALAAGAKTYKLRYGHRGHNQPCMDVATKRCFITSQNHGYAVDENSLPDGWKVSFKNLNDGTVEGICHVSLPFSAVQFHPEAAPGPTDTEWLFERFVAQL